MFDCGVPREFCSGRVVMAQAGVREGYRAHDDRDSALRCARRHVRALNEADPTGPVHLPSKPTRLKPGKAGKDGQGSVRFIVPKVRG